MSGIYGSFSQMPRHWATADEVNVMRRRKPRLP